MNNDELKELFLAEANQNLNEMEQFFLQLEKAKQDIEAIDGLFRITHTLKANAAALGYEHIAELSHLLEDIFGKIKSNPSAFSTSRFNDLYRAHDKLREMVEAVKDDSKVSYKGLLTKIKVLKRELSQELNLTPDKVSESSEEIADQNNEAIVHEEVETSPDAPNQKAFKFADSINIPIHRLDDLLKLVGELSIERDRLHSKLVNAHQVPQNEFKRLKRLVAELQYGIMNTRLVKVGLLMQKFHRVVRDVAQIEQKEVSLILEGQDIEVDRKILPILSESMLHLVRNAISHGIELPEVREQTGKNREGRLYITAYNAKEQVIIDIQDDGKGLNMPRIRQKIAEMALLTHNELEQLSAQEIQHYIFAPGFSSAEKVTEVSGRGVGLDVVKSSIELLGGKISIKSNEGEGCLFRLVLPASIATKPALLFSIEQEPFAVPLVYAETVLRVNAQSLHEVGGGLIYPHKGYNMPVIYLKDLFRKVQNSGEKSSWLKHSYQNESQTELLLLQVSDGSRNLGLVIDNAPEQRELIDTNLAPPLNQLEFIASASITDSGKVCLILNIPYILNFVL